MNKKYTLTLVLILLSISITFCQDETHETRNTVVQNGVGLGTIIAVVISWSQNKSILWVIIHGILGWFYVIYYFFTRK